MDYYLMKRNQAPTAQTSKEERSLALTDLLIQDVHRVGMGRARGGASITSTNVNRMKFDFNDRASCTDGASGVASIHSRQISSF